MFQKRHKTKPAPAFPSPSHGSAGPVPSPSSAGGSSFPAPLTLLPRRGRLGELGRSRKAPRDPWAADCQARAGFRQRRSRSGRSGDTYPSHAAPQAGWVLIPASQTGKERREGAGPPGRAPACAARARTAVALLPWPSGHPAPGCTDPCPHSLIRCAASGPILTLSESLSKEERSPGCPCRNRRWGRAAAFARWPFSLRALPARPAGCQHS